MTATVIPTMIVDDIEPCARPSLLKFYSDPMECEHRWEPHLWETGRAHCPRCGSYARWGNDPRIEENPS